MRVLVVVPNALLVLVLVLLTCSCSTSAQEMASQKKLCACQREGGFVDCYKQVSALCTSFGEYASGVPMCQFDWSKMDSLALNPVAFMRIIKASAVMCKHPYEFNVTEMASFLGATGMKAFQKGFLSQKITGAMMTELTLEQLTDKLNGTLGDAMSFMEGKVVAAAAAAAVGVSGVMPEEK